MDIDKLTWRKVSDLNKEAPPPSKAALRQELKYLRSKERFIKHGHYLPMTTHNYQLAANQSYFGVVSVNRTLTQMKLSCGHWLTVPAANPLPSKWMDAARRFCSECADKKYRQIMLAEIEESEKAIQAVLRPLSPWWMFNPNAYFRPKQAACEVQRRRWARIKTWPRFAR